MICEWEFLILTAKHAAGVAASTSPPPGPKVEGILCLVLMWICASERIDDASARMATSPGDVIKFRGGRPPEGEQFARCPMESDS